MKLAEELRDKAVLLANIPNFKQRQYDNTELVSEHGMNKLKYNYEDVDLSREFFKFDGMIKKCYIIDIITEKVYLKPKSASKLPSFPFIKLFSSNNKSSLFTEKHYSQHPGTWNHLSCVLFYKTYSTTTQYKPLNFHEKIIAHKTRFIPGTANSQYFPLKI